MSVAYQQRIIRSARLWLEHVISSFNKKIRELQTQCTHPNKTYKHHENYLGYDGFSTERDAYTTFDCPDCGKYWREDCY